MGDPAYGPLVAYGPGWWLARCPRCREILARYDFDDYDAFEFGLDALKTHDCSKGGEHMAQTRTRNSRSDSKPKSNGRAKKNEPKKWDGDPDFAVAFHRPENSGNQPGYSGQGLIDRATLKAIAEAGGEIQIACWVRRARSGVKYISIHIEPPYVAENDADDLLDEDVTEDEDDDDDMPF